jgi:hypothetical protein
MAKPASSSPLPTGRRTHRREYPSSSSPGAAPPRNGTPAPERIRVTSSADSRRKDATWRSIPGRGEAPHHRRRRRHHPPRAASSTATAFVTETVQPGQNLHPHA